MAAEWQNGEFYDITLRVRQDSYTPEGGFTGEAEIIDAGPAEMEEEPDEAETKAMPEKMPKAVVIAIAARGKQKPK